MRDKYVKFKGFIILVLLLCLVGIKTTTVYATDSDRHLTGEKDTKTTINDPGTAQTPEDLQELNIANSLTVTYNDGNGRMAGSLRILLTLTAIALLPTLIICMTSFVRILIVLHFTRTALNTQTAPPNQVLIALALFLTFFIMSPTIETINTEAIKPFEAGEITQEEALKKGMEPLRVFMYGQTQKKDAQVLAQIGGYEWSDSLDDIPNAVLIPAFMISELRTAFIIGFLIYVPFLVIDMVVSSALMSMGMMMLPPTTISMPFKILLFVLADGWNLIIVNLVRTFY